MRISDWSSDVCSSDLAVPDPARAGAQCGAHRAGRAPLTAALAVADAVDRVRQSRHGAGHRGSALFTETADRERGSDGSLAGGSENETGRAIAARPAVFRHLAWRRAPRTGVRTAQLGRASCRRRVFQTVQITVVAGSLKIKINIYTLDI